MTQTEYKDGHRVSFSSHNPGVKRGQIQTLHHTREVTCLLLSLEDTMYSEPMFTRRSCALSFIMKGACVCCMCMCLCTWVFPLLCCSSSRVESCQIVRAPCCSRDLRGSAFFIFSFFPVMMIFCSDSPETLCSSTCSCLLSPPLTSSHLLSPPLTSSHLLSYLQGLFLLLYRTSLPSSLSFLFSLSPPPSLSSCTGYFPPPF